MSPRLLIASLIVAILLSAVLYTESAKYRSLAEERADSLQSARLDVAVMRDSLKQMQYAEGESQWLFTGDTRRFISLPLCEAEAKARHEDGSPQYSGFECRGMFGDLITTVRRYTDGELISQTVVPGAAGVFVLVEDRPRDQRGIIATFSSDSGADRNRANCQALAVLLSRQSADSLKYKVC